MDVYTKTKIIVRRKPRPTLQTRAERLVLDGLHQMRLLQASETEEGRRLARVAAVGALFFAMVSKACYEVGKSAAMRTSQEKSFSEAATDRQDPPQEQPTRENQTSSEQGSAKHPFED